ncbi:hypothetical protein GMB86_11125 [Terrilactibacillus sp. BCM23-1]|uniref:Fur-regulated basic protein FbpA n=1 Tax=Terrilactibacillus tamarindi TaxID=2599694 RepID=A0A6N8CQQ4_9BACI|nr:hypothetical protein [Terrilactibacillus tamarindi]MTT32559.1 hypothetical protein [Terrilactibacillus tamarindi]
MERPNNILRAAVMKRKAELVDLIKANAEESESDLLGLTLSELEEEWKRYQDRYSEDQFH